MDEKKKRRKSPAVAAPKRKKAVSKADDDSDQEEDSGKEGSNNVSEDEGDGEDAGAQEDDAEDDDDDDENDEGSDSDAVAAKRRRAKKAAPPKKKADKKKGGDDVTAALKRPTRLSAATLKTRMSPAMLQNPIARRKIWNNLQQMMERRGYTWVSDRPAPTDYEQLLPNNKGVLGFFHLHAVDATDAKREPVHVIFCSKAGEPTLKSLQYPSHHILLISDSLTGRARGALNALHLKAPPTQQVANVVTASTAAAGAAGVAAVTTEAIVLKDVFVEPFVSSFFMFDLLRQRYLRVVQFAPVSPAELEKVFDVFEKKREITRFPRMLDTDPVVRHLRLPVGSVIKQTRLSTAAGSQEAYRIIVRAP